MMVGTSLFPDLVHFFYNYQLVGAQHCNELLGDYVSASVAALLASVSIVAVTYIFSILLSNNKLNAWSKVELTEILVSAIILLAVPSLHSFYCNFSLLGTGSIFTDVSKVMLSINSNLAAVGLIISFLSFAFDFITSPMISAVPLGFGASGIQPLLGFAVILRPIFTATTMSIATGIVLNTAFLMAADYFSSAFIMFFFPLAIFLRSFLPTRRIGGTILALIVAFSFIYPVLIIIEGTILNYMNVGPDNGNLFTNYFESTIDTLSRIPLIGSTIEKLANFFRGMFTGHTTIGDLSTLLSVIGVYWGTGKLFGALSSLSSLGLGVAIGASILVILVEIAPFIGGIILVALKLFVMSLSYTILVTLIFPTINTIVLITAVKDLSKMIGEQIDISNLLRLI